MLAETLLQDLRYAVRILTRNAGFTAVSLVALALGIGLNTAAFTAWKAMIARPLDARDPGTMLNVALTLHSGRSSPWFSYPDYETYRDHVHSCSGMIAAIPDRLTLSAAGRVISDRTAVAGSLLGRLGMLPATANNAEFASTFLVSENYFSVLGVPPVRGRAFDSMARAELAGTPSVLISWNYWQTRFAGDPAILGKTIRLNGAAFTIIGITPRDFVGTTIAVPDFWMPLSLEPLVNPESDWLRDRETPNLRMFGRLAPGATMAQAQAEINLVAAHLRALHRPGSDLSKPAAAMVWRASPFPLKISGGLRLTIVLIAVAVGLVLVIACANVASLQLARATSRQNELGMRLCLGASRGRLIRQLLTESALLGLLAGAIALPFTWALLQIMVAKLGELFPSEYGTLIFHVTPDAEVFAWAFAISAFAGLLFGVAPALESSRSALFSTVRGSAGTAAVRSRRMRDVLIAAQVAVSLVLMISGSMLIHSAIRALRMDTGYDTRHTVELTFRFPEGSGYTADRALEIARELRARVASLPGVDSISSGRAPDDTNLRTAAVSLNGEKPTPGNLQALIDYSWVQPNYFATLGIPLVRGHGFRPQASQPERAVILSESAAQKLWPGRNPIGRSLRLGTEQQYHGPAEIVPDGPGWQVIGIARDTRGTMLDGSDSAQVYLPIPENRVRDFPILIRMRRDPALMTRAIDAAVAAVNPDVIVSTATLEDMLRQTQSFLADSFAAVIAVTIGLFGLVLAAMGIYGTVSYMAVLRTREVGIRMAIGAQKRDILVLMIRESARPVLAGIASGIVLSMGASYLLRGVLYGIGAVDPASFGGMSLLFLAIALLATYPPSRRAMRVDPMVALRYE